jgi:hypothetical protein
MMVRPCRDQTQSEGWRAIEAIKVIEGVLGDVMNEPDFAEAGKGEAIEA